MRQTERDRDGNRVVETEVKMSGETEGEIRSKRYRNGGREKGGKSGAERGEGTCAHLHRKEYVYRPRSQKEGNRLYRNYILIYVCSEVFTSLNLARADKS